MTTVQLSDLELSDGTTFEETKAPKFPSQGFGIAASAYLDGGWEPLFVKGKSGVPSGFTGRAGKRVTGKQVAEWVRDFPNYNIAVKATGLISIDVDEYGDKHGAAQLEALEAQLGALPATYTVTSRGDDSKSRQYLFRAPEGMKFLRKAADDIDVVQETHRYIMVPPSIHPETGEQYKFYDKSGVAMEGAPTKTDDIPDLPDAWREYLKREDNTVSRAAVGPVPQAEEWVTTLTPGKPHKALQNSVMKFDGLHHDTMVSRFQSVISNAFIDPEQPGLRTLFDETWELYMTSSAASTAVWRRENDMWRAIQGGLSLAVANKEKREAEQAQQKIYAERLTARSKVKDAVSDHTAEDEILNKSDPEIYLNKRTVRPRTVADAISYDLAIGVDKMIWMYENGVWRPAHTGVDDEVTRRMTLLLKDFYNSGQVGTVKDSIIHTQNLLRLNDVPNKELINLRNGMYEWRTKTLHPHNPSFGSTSQLTFGFDPEATCPKFDAWLREVVPLDAIPLVWQVIAYLLMPGNHMHRAFLLYGPGGSGKSTFLRVIERMIATKDISHLTLRQISENGFPVADLFGKVANIVGDLDARYLSDTAMFKQITGGDTISAARKGEHSFTFTPHAVPVFSANEIWTSGDSTEGYFRRWAVLPFPNQVMHKNPGFSEEPLYAEVAGIFNKAMAVLPQLIEDDDFLTPPSALALIDQFKDESDPIRTWLSNDPSVSVDKGNTSMKADTKTLFNHYKTWCESNGIKPRSKIKLGRDLSAMFGKGQESNSKTWITGIAVDSTKRADLLDSYDALTARAI